MIKFTKKELKIKSDAHKHIREIFEFNEIRRIAELNALSKVSLERPLTQDEHFRFKELMNNE